MKKTIFLKLGGSLITNKYKPLSVRRRVLKRISMEIAAALNSDPNINLLIGHGSGSFGHYAADIYDTVNGVKSIEQWKGFAEVWKDARTLNQLVVEQLSACGLPVMVFPPSAMVICDNKNIISWEIQPLENALNLNLIPVTYGDVVFDSALGGTILSTEELFVFLAHKIKPQRVLLAGIEKGVWGDFPRNKHLIAKITPNMMRENSSAIGGSQATDVTGGMAQKVSLMSSLVEMDPILQVVIFSGKKTGMITKALGGKSPGTSIQIR